MSNAKTNELNQHRRFFLLRGLLVCVALFALAVSTAEAFQIRVPTPRKGALKPMSALTGMACRVDTGDTEGYGYRTVRFRFDAAAATPGDRQVTVRFLASSNHPSRGELQPTLAIEKDGILVANATNVEIPVAAPHFRPWNAIWWDVWVDGVRDPALSRDAKAAISHPSQPQPFESLAVLALPNRTPEVAAPMWLSFAPTEEFAITPSEAPATWLEYSQHDVVLASLPTLIDLKTDQPERFSLLQKWVESGGTLWVADVSDDGYTELDDLLEVDGRLHWAEDPEKSTNYAAAGWRWAWVRDPATEANKPKSVDELIEEKTGDTKTRPPGERTWFAEKRYGFGNVVAFLPLDEADRDARRFSNRRFRRSLDNNPKQAAAIEYLLQHSWTQRHGLAPDLANGDFSNLLVPGVGLAPVIEFQLLITLFAIVVGPLNYWLLKRKQRTHLMVLTVPLLAASITLSLLLYALLGDGFGTKVRVREVTLIDQTRGERTTWGRLSYYAGLAPNDGLNLPRNCVMYPILPGWNELGMVGDTPPTREVAWTPQGQQLKGGWLRSRAPTQYLQVSTGATEQRIEISTKQDVSTATNNLGAEIEWLVVFDKQGNLLQANDVPDGSQATLEPTDYDNASREARTRVIRNEPYPPDGLTNKDDFSLVDEERRVIRKRLQRELNFDYAAARTSESLLNSTLDDLAGLSGDESLRLPPRSYVAFTKAAVGAELGFDGVRQLGGFHVVIGRW